MPDTERSLPEPATLIALLVSAQIVGWTLAPVITHTAPPLDVVESTMWGREWVIATYKHPALPSWVLEASRLLTGSVGWPAYLVSQTFVASTFVFVFLLGRDLMGAERAAAGTLLLTGVAFYAWPTPEFNHNIAEMPFWAGLAWALWRAVERKAILWWVLVGAFGAGGLYAKLSTGLLLVTAAAWILSDRHARECLKTPGPWLGLAVFAGLSAPLASWLVAHDFAPLRYAALRSSTPGPDVHLFALSIFTNVAGLLVMAAVAGLIGPRRKAADPGWSGPNTVDRRALTYLAFITAGPLLLAVLGALLTRSGLRTAWGSSMFNLLGLLVVAYTASRFGRQALWRIAVFAAVLLIVFPLGYALVIGSTLLRTVPRVRWPQAEIAERMGGIWARETGRPLRIVTGNNWVAGLVGITSKDRPSILNNGDPAYSPWITPGRSEADGMLVVWQTGPNRLSPALEPLTATYRIREERFSLPRSRRGQDLVLNYIIVPPKQGPR